MFQRGLQLLGTLAAECHRVAIAQRIFSFCYYGVHTRHGCWYDWLHCTCSCSGTSTVVVVVVVVLDVVVEVVVVVCMSLHGGVLDRTTSANQLYLPYQYRNAGQRCSGAVPFGGRHKIYAKIRCMC